MRFVAHRDYWLCPCHTRSKDRGAVCATGRRRYLRNRSLAVVSGPGRVAAAPSILLDWFSSGDPALPRAFATGCARSLDQHGRARADNALPPDDAGHDLALGQMPVAHQPLATIVGQLSSMHAKQGCNLASVTRSIRMRFSIHTASRNGNCSYGGLTLALVNFRARLRQPWRTRLGPISRRPAVSARSAVASCARNAPRSA